jgi:hypothetical protein
VADSKGLELTLECVLQGLGHRSLVQLIVLLREVPGVAELDCLSEQVVPLLTFDCLRYERKVLPQPEPGMQFCQALLFDRALLRR